MQQLTSDNHTEIYDFEVYIIKNQCIQIFNHQGRKNLRQSNIYLATPSFPLIPKMGKGMGIKTKDMHNLEELPKAN